jgi:4-carboxymuconolactone decarboxylase
VVSPEETLARIALRDDQYIHALPGGEDKAAGLEWPTCALVRLAALIGLDGSMPSFVATVRQAKTAGVTDSEIVSTLTAVLPSVGAVRASSAAPKLALALGYDPDVMLDEDNHRVEPQRVNPEER